MSRYSENADGACADMLHIHDKIDSIGDQLSKLTELMERQVRLEEQSASQGAAVGRAFETISKIDVRVGKLEEVEHYARAALKTLTGVALLVAAVLGWSLKSQSDIIQQLPVKLDRIERQQAEFGKVDDHTAMEIQKLKEIVNAR